MSKHDKGYCVKASDRLLSQTNRHTAVIKARDTYAVSKHETHCCVKPRDTLLYQSTTQVLWRTRPPSNTAALSQHNTPDRKSTSKHRTPHTSTDPTLISRKTCFGALGGEEKGAAAVSKHEAGTVTKQTTGTLQFMVAFTLQGRGGNSSGNISHFVVPWEARGPSPPK